MITDLIDPSELRALSNRSDRAGLVQLFSHLGAIGATGTLLHLAWGSVLAVPVFIAHGVLINFLYAGQHETSHWTAFRTRWMNEWVGRVFGFFLLYPRDFDQIQHHAHHRYTQDWERDGELGRPPYDRASYVLWLLGPTYWATRIARIIRFTRGTVVERYIPASRHADVIREARIHAGLYAAIAVISVAVGSWAAVIYWLAPMLTTKAAHQLQNTIEHLGLPHVEDTLLNTRSTRTSALMRWLCWNMQYHTAHHAFPGVPFHNLAGLHTAMFDGRGKTPPMMSYWQFQKAVWRAFEGGRTERDFPEREAWIAER